MADPELNRVMITGAICTTGFIGRRLLQAGERARVGLAEEVREMPGFALQK